MRHVCDMTKFHISQILAGAIAFGLSTTESAHMLINGAGATFPYPIYSKWIEEYTNVDQYLRLNYKSIGSVRDQQQLYAQPDNYGSH